MGMRGVKFMMAMNEYKVWRCCLSDLRDLSAQLINSVHEQRQVLAICAREVACKLYETCTTDPICPFPEASQWCAFTKNAAPSITPTFWSYASSASSWWSAKSSGASSVALRCPNTWYKIMKETPGGDIWLNDTIIFSECYESAHPPTPRPSLSGSAKLQTKPTTGPTLTPTSASRKVVRAPWVATIWGNGNFAYCFWVDYLNW